MIQAVEYVIAMALGFVLAYAAAFALAYFGWVVVESEGLVMISFFLLGLAWLIGPAVGVWVLHRWRDRHAPIADERATDSGETAGQ